VSYRLVPFVLDQLFGPGVTAPAGGSSAEECRPGHAEAVDDLGQPSCVPAHGVVRFVDACPLDDARAEDLDRGGVHLSAAGLLPPFELVAPAAFGDREEALERGFGERMAEQGLPVPVGLVVKSVHGARTEQGECDRGRDRLVSLQPALVVEEIDAVGTGDEERWTPEEPDVESADLVESPPVVLRQPGREEVPLARQKEGVVRDGKSGQAERHGWRSSGGDLRSVPVCAPVDAGVACPEQDGYLTPPSTPTHIERTP
jgi:hypothetical protein